MHIVTPKRGRRGMSGVDTGGGNRAATAGEGGWERGGRVGRAALPELRLCAQAPRGGSQGCWILWLWRTWVICPRGALGAQQKNAIVSCWPEGKHDGKGSLACRGDQPTAGSGRGSEAFPSQSPADVSDLSSTRAVPRGLQRGGGCAGSWRGWGTSSLSPTSTYHWPG